MNIEVALPEPSQHCSKCCIVLSKLTVTQTRLFNGLCDKCDELENLKN